MTAEGLNTPTISICIPTCNGAAHLADAIESARAQTYGDIEILIVDDVSEDATFSIARQHADHDSRIQVTRNDRRLGLPGNWNRCVELARGEWIKFLFQDDVLDRTCLERLRAAARPGIDLVACQRTPIVEEGTNREFLQEYLAYVAVHDFKARLGGSQYVSAEALAEVIVDFPTANCIGEPSVMLIRRDAFQRFGAFHPDLRQLVDWELAIRIGVQAGMCYVPEALVRIRLHPNMATIRQSAGSRFRSDVLDSIVILHELAFAALFEPVRRAAARRPSPLAFEALLQLEAVKVDALAARLSSSGAVGRSPLDDWHELTARYPRLVPRSSPVATASGDALALAAFDGFLASSASLTFQVHVAPVVSVILVLRDRAELTFRALRSLQADDSISIECIVVDNGSTDATEALLARCRGVVIARNAENIGYGPAVNQGASLARGTHLLLLNNDAELLPGSLASALRTIAPGIGAVGGRLILEDGRLQEAGSIVWNDATALGYGRGQNPFAGPYGFERVVDYCSAALLLTPRQTFAALDGFDPAYAPAYYEDADYCFRLRERGLQVVYDPTFIARHTEFASSSSSDAALALQAKHRATFQARHTNALAEQSSPSPARVLWARMREVRGLRILFLDDQVPHDWLGAGLPRSRQIVQALVDDGHFVTFYPLVSYETGTRTGELPRLVEVMGGSGPGGLREFLIERRDYYDRILVSRPHNFEMFQQATAAGLREALRGTVIYDAEAIFASRDAQLARLRGGATQTLDRLAAELTLARDADVVVTVSDADRKTFVDAGCSPTIVVRHRVDAALTPQPFEARRGFLFVGPIRDEWSPNSDGVVWFITEVLPFLEAALRPTPPVTVVGETGSARVSAAAEGRVTIRGVLPDLFDTYDAARVFIAPIRAAAGIPLKVLHAAASGLPVVCTTRLAQQLGWQNEIELLTADDASEFARACARLHEDPTLWMRLREAAFRRVSDECSRSTFAQAVRHVLDQPAPKRRDRSEPFEEQPREFPSSVPVTASVPQSAGTERLEEALRNARQEIIALHQSMSWRVTAPLRRAYDVILRIRGR